MKEVSNGILAVSVKGFEWRKFSQWKVDKILINCRISHFPFNIMMFFVGLTFVQYVCLQCIDGGVIFVRFLVHVCMSFKLTRTLGKERQIFF